MNRRNFILGLGTAATLSGAASVTSASLQGTVAPGADFRILSAQQLTVRRNPDIQVENAEGENETNASLDGYVNTTADYVGEEGSFNFTGQGSGTLNNSGGPNLTVDSGDNGELNMSLATPNDNSTDANRNATLDGSPYYNESATNGNAPLQVVNNGAADADVGVSYGYGEDVGTGSNEIPEETVNQLFEFAIAGNQVSPDGSTNEPADYETVTSGGDKLVNFDINYSQDIESELRANLSSGFGASGDNLQLLEFVRFGVDGNN